MCFPECDWSSYSTVMTSTQNTKRKFKINSKSKKKDAQMYVWTLFWICCWYLNQSKKHKVVGICLNTWTSKIFLLNKLKNEVFVGWNVQVRHIRYIFVTSTRSRLTTANRPFQFFFVVGTRNRPFNNHESTFPGVLLLLALATGRLQ